LDQIFLLALEVPKGYAHYALQLCSHYKSRYVTVIGIVYGNFKQSCCAAASEKSLTLLAHVITALEGEEGSGLGYEAIFQAIQQSPTNGAADKGVT
jgi:hypothetical protein